MYLVTGTRPDLAFVVGHLAQFMSNPGPLHWSAVKRNFRYLQHTCHMGIRYKSTPTTTTILHG